MPYIGLESEEYKMNTQLEIKLLFDNFSAYLVEKENELNLQPEIEQLFIKFAEFLIEKNKRYGDAALSPENIFSDAPPGAQICVRLDDKLARIKYSDELKKNDLADLFGYVALLLISNGWTEFDDLLD